MAPGDGDIHEAIHDEIASRLDTLRSGVPTTGPSGESWSEAEVNTAVEDLEADAKLLRDHWRTGAQTTSGYPPAIAAACGQPQPCPHVLGLASKYGLLPG